MNKWFGIEGRFDYHAGWLRVGRRWFGFYRRRFHVIPVIAGGGKAVTVQTGTWAFGDDDGSESGHSLDTEGAARTAQVADVTFMIRIQVEETGGGAENQGFALFAAKDDASGVFTEVTTSRTDGIRIANDTQSRADNENTTERLSAGAGTFTAGKYDDGQTQQGTTAIALQSQYTDLEFAIEIDSANAADGDWWDLRVEFSDGTDLDTYNGTYPRVTADIAIVINLSAGSITASGQTLSVVPGARTIPLDAASAIATGQALQVVPGARTIPLSAGSLLASGQVLQVVPGARTISLQAASLTATGQTITVSLVTVVQLQAGSITAIGRPVTVVPGGTIINLAVAIATATGQVITIDAPGGPITIPLDAGSIVATGQQLQVVPGAVTIPLSAASAIATGQTITVINITGITIPLNAGSLTATGQPVAVIAGAITVPLQSGTITANGQTLTVAPGGVTIQLSVAVLTATGQQTAIISIIIPNPENVDFVPYRDKRDIVPFRDKRDFS
jgi:hypothetical protein